VVGTCCTIAWLVLLARVIDDVFLGDASVLGEGPTVAGSLAAMAALLVLRSVCSWLSEVLADRASGRLRSSVRAELVEHLYAVGPAGLSDERIGEVAVTIGEGVESLDDYVTRFVPAAGLAVVAPLLVGAAVTVLDPWTTLILLFTGPMLVLLLAVIGSRTRALTQRRFDELGWLSSFYLDMIRGLGTLKAFGRSQEGAEQIERVSRRFGDTTMEVLRTAFQTSLVMEWASTAATALAAVEVSFRIIGDVMPFGRGLAVLVLVPEFFVPFRRLAVEYHAGQSGRAAEERIDELLALPAAGRSMPATAAPAATPVGSSGPAQERLGGSPPRLEWRDVTFRYPGQPRDALAGFDLVIEPGETVALVGPSGAGKTTASRLLLRFVEPDRGALLVDDVDLSGVDPTEWRRRIAWVPQDPTVVAGTVADNIRLGVPDAPWDALRRAAEVARATGFVEALPDGFDTVLGERGLRLSGGQRQRLAIARAALRDAPVVVLDEFTAHLDERTELELLEAMAELLQGRTALVIAHRRRTLDLADRVVRLVDGRVAT
jgi:thiol reductant ABC exporter CydD subunit